MKLTNKLTILAGLLCMTLFYACDKEEPVEGSLPVADAGPDMDASVGSTVTLDGSGSSDADNDVLTFSWELTATPAGSSASIQNASAAVASFTPDVAGSYTATLSVVDGNNTPQTDEAIITVEESVAETIVINENITEDTVWEDVFEDDRPDYHVTGNIDVAAVLTVMPGVIVEVDQGLGIEITSNGVLIADGASDNHITFTSSNTAGNVKWQGLYIVSGDQRNALNNVSVEYGGSDDYIYVYNSINEYVPANVSLGDNAKISITNSSIAESSGAGIVASPNAEILSFGNVEVTNNDSYAVLVHPNVIEVFDNTSSFSGNGTNGVVFYQGELTNGSESTWAPLAEGIAYYGLGELTVSNLLTIDAGVEIQMEQELFISISSDGGFIANGTVNDPITFTAINASNGLRWGGLYVNSGDSRNILNNVNIAYGGGKRAGYIYDGINAYVEANVYIDENAVLNIENTTISNSTSYGLVIQDGGELGSFSSNEFEQNESFAALMGIYNVPQLDGGTIFDSNNHNAIRLFQSTISENATLPKLDDSGFYRVAANVGIAGDVSVEAGAVFHVDEGVFINVNSAGSLSAIGTSSQHITFTSSNVSGNIHWGGISFDSGSSLNELDYVDVSYGGGDDMFYFYGSFNGNVQSNIGVTADAQLTINNCTVSNSPDYGITIKENGVINGSTVATPGNITSVTDVNTFANINSQNVAFED